MAERVVDALIDALSAMGVARIFGVPGGGSSLDIIAAANHAGIEFVLCRTEVAAGLMAAVTGEITDCPGVVLTGIGPSAASIVNAIAYASLERAPLILITDCDENDPNVSPHQIFDQQALFAPITKATLRLEPQNARAELKTLIDLTLQDPRGPIHVDLSPKNARALLPDLADAETASKAPLIKDQTAYTGLIDLLKKSRRPVLIAGLQMRRTGLAESLQMLAGQLGCPVLVSYKAKGVFDESDLHFAGVFTGATAEADILSKADLILTLGLDPIEMIPSPWTYEAKVGVVMQAVTDAFPFTPDANLEGDLKQNIDHLAKEASQSAWQETEIAALRVAMRKRLALKEGGHTADSIIDDLVKYAPNDVRLAVDAGAHMFSAMVRWPASRPHDVLKSNGLSTMGFALPAALASYLHDPSRPVIAVTGDGGLFMCLAELSTASRLNIPVLVVVLNDAALSLIDIKQQHLQHAESGVRYPPVDFAAAARGLGCKAWSVGRDQSFESVLSEALSETGPRLIDVTTDPSGYLDQLIALRK